jgi:hypothetical protein
MTTARTCSGSTTWRTGTAINGGGEAPPVSTTVILDLIAQTSPFRAVKVNPRAVAPELGGDVGLLIRGAEMQDLAAHGLEAAHLDHKAQVGDGDAGTLDADNLP